MFTKAFWLGATDRAVKSAAQALALLWGGSEFNLLHIDPAGAFGISAGALVLSYLTSLVSAPAGDAGSTSFLKGGV